MKRQLSEFLLVFFCWGVCLLVIGLAYAWFHIDVVITFLIVILFFVIRILIKLDDRW